MSAATKLSPDVDLKPATERAKCSFNPAYFVDQYCWLKTEQEGMGGADGWARFRPWPAQVLFGKTILDNDRIVALKARQLGFTWYALALILWLTILKKPGATVIIFSKKEDDAADLIKRMTGMLKRLPEWLINCSYKAKFTEIEFSNNSRIMAFPTTGGHSYTATWALIDEADKLPIDLRDMMEAVEPTVSAGGKLIVLSTVTKKKQNSYFKKLYIDAKAKRNIYTPIFMPWHARPDRDQAWYDRETKGKPVDSIWQEFPATDTEALAPNVADKRINQEWLKQCYIEAQPLEKIGPAINGLVIYKEPTKTGRYVIGSDTAEGNPRSDDSVATVLDLVSGEEVACLCGKLEPAELGDGIDKIGTYFNNAPVLVERNNHGHAVLLWLKQNSSLRLLEGYDKKPGWLTNEKGKSLLYSTASEMFRDADCIIHSFLTWEQLSNIEGSTQSAPNGFHDDRAMSFVIALQAQVMLLKKMGGNFGFGGGELRGLPEEINPHRNNDSVANQLSNMQF